MLKVILFTFYLMAMMLFMLEKPTTQNQESNSIEYQERHLIQFNSLNALN